MPPNAEKLKAVRAAAQRSQARAQVDLEKWYETPEPPYGHLLLAWELLFAQATQESPGECLRIVTDVIRLSQDAGTGVIGHVTATYAPRMAPLVAIPCALRANPAERAAAERELAVLITQGPPMAGAIELERLALSARLRRAIHAASPTLTAGPWGEHFDRSNAIDALHTLMSMKPHGSPPRGGRRDRRGAEVRGAGLRRMG